MFWRREKGKFLKKIMELEAVIMELETKMVRDRESAEAFLGKIRHEYSQDWKKEKQKITAEYEVKWEKRNSDLTKDYNHMVKEHERISLKEHEFNFAKEAKNKLESEILVLKEALEIKEMANIRLKELLVEKEVKKKPARKKAIKK